MLIVDSQIHLWEKRTPSPPHRQEPYSAEQAIPAMDQAGVDRALIHPVLWDPDSNVTRAVMGSSAPKAGIVPTSGRKRGQWSAV
jgi:hypothetical protein